MPSYIQHKKVKVPYKYLYVNSLPNISSQTIKENLVKIRFQELKVNSLPVMYMKIKIIKIKWKYNEAEKA